MRLLWEQKVEHVVLVLVGDVKLSDYIHLGRGIVRGRGDVDSIFLQLYNVASGWP